jgi:hypothetical protein
MSPLGMLLPGSLPSVPDLHDKRVQVLDSIRRCSVTDNTNNGQSASGHGPAGGNDEQVLNPTQPAATGGGTPSGGAASEPHVNQPIAIRSTSSEARR